GRRRIGITGAWLRITLSDASWGNSSLGSRCSLRCQSSHFGTVLCTSPIHKRKFSGRTSHCGFWHGIDLSVSANSGSLRGLLPPKSSRYGYAHGISLPRWSHRTCHGGLSHGLCWV